MRKLWITLSGELALEEALDPSKDRLLNECTTSFKSGCVTFLVAAYVKERLYAVKHDNKA